MELNTDALRHMLTTCLDEIVGVRTELVNLQDKACVTAKADLEAALHQEYANIRTINFSVIDFAWNETRSIFTIEAHVIQDCKRLKEKHSNLRLVSDGGYIHMFPRIEVGAGFAVAQQCHALKQKISKLEAQMCALQKLINLA